MKRFIMTLYAALYVGIAVSFVVVEYTSIKVGWKWISTLVMPMGYMFLLINVPLAFIGVIKIGHMVFLHSVQHHRNVMRQIRQADMAITPPLARVDEENLKDGTVSIQSRTVGTLSQNVLSQDVPLSQGVKSDNRIVAEYLVDHPGASIREVERVTGVSRSNVGRTPAWKNR